jgi:hypothetical protein
MAIKKISMTRQKKARFKVYAMVVFSLFIGVGMYFTLKNLETIKLFFVGASGTEASISVDAEAILGPMPRPWRNLAQGGESDSWRMQQITASVKALNPEYVRIDHLYDFYALVQTDGSINFTKLDTLLKDIQATGAKPFISLSYTPPVIAPEGNITGMPTNLGTYQSVIRKTIEHVSRDLGIRDVIYEVWNEPDLFGGFKVYGGKNYLTIYSLAAKAADQAAASGAQPFLFGGPATTALYQNWFEGLFKFVTENKLRLDYVSWHRYAKDITQFEDDAKKARFWMGAYPQFADLPLFITEWGHDSNNHAGYDNNYAAAHTAAGSIQMVGQIQRAFVFEIQDGKDPAGKANWGRWGLLTHSEFGSSKKPRYNALKFIDQIFDQRLAISGTGTWVKGMAARQGDTVRIILANFDPVGSHAETVPVTISNLAGSNYRISIVGMNGTSQNKEQSVFGGVLTFEVPMRANSVVMIDTIPL